MTKKPTSPSLPRRIIEYANTLAEGTPITPASLLHLGNRAAVNQALTRLVRRRKLERIYHGIYVLRMQGRFGPYLPCSFDVVRALAKMWGETIVPCGGAAANWVGLITQNVMREIYYTSGPSRKLYFGRHMVELRRAPRWQLVAPGRKAGDVIRALAWMGPEEAPDALGKVIPRFSQEDCDELAAARALLPIWLAEIISQRIANGQIPLSATVG